jgi:hypothetical protein
MSVMSVGSGGAQRGAGRLSAGCAVRLVAGAHRWIEISALHGANRPIDVAVTGFSAPVQQGGHILQEGATLAALDRLRGLPELRQLIVR